MKSVYIMAAWDSLNQTNPTILSFTSRAMAIAVAKDYRDNMQFTRVIIRRDICNSPIGWNSCGEFIDF